MELILLKLGGSLITDKGKPFTPRLDVMGRLAREIHEARAESDDVRLVIGHGGGSFPHSPAKKYRVHEGVVGGPESYRGIAEVQDAAARLNRIMVGELIDAGENAVSINPSSCCIAESGTIKTMYLDPLKRLLDYDMVPVPYGDVGLDLKTGCCILSTEEILFHIAERFVNTEYEPKKILVCGVVDGVYTADPTKEPGAKFVPEITPDNMEVVRAGLGGSSGIDVTGGMVHKVEKLLEVARLGIESEIINGLKPGVLKRALLGETGLGTVIK